MGTKQILPTRFLHLPEVTSPGQTMNLQHISRCGKQTNHFPNFLPEEKENGPFLPPWRSFLPRCPRFFPALADLIHRSHNSAPWLDLGACQLFSCFGSQPSSLHSRKKPYLVVLAAALKARTQIFIRLILDSEYVFLRRRKVSEVPLRHHGTTKCFTVQ